MTSWEIEAAWPLVIRHRAAVVRFMETAGSVASLRRRKCSRRAIIDGYDENHDIPRLAAQIGLSPRGPAAVLARAVRLARGFESGRLRQRKLRRRFSLTLTDLPAALINDIDKWARMRGKSRRDAAIELLKVGLDVMSERAERQAKAPTRNGRSNR